MSAGGSVHRRVLLLALLGSLAAACGGEPDAVVSSAGPPRPAFDGVWDVRLLAPAAVGIAADVALSPDASRVAVAGQDGVVRLVEAGGEVSALAGHAARVLRVSFAPDGGLLASASADGTVRLWAVDGSYEVLDGHGAPVVDVVWLRGSARLATLCVDGTTRVFGTPGSPPVVIGSADLAADRIAAVFDGAALALASRTRGTLSVAGSDGTPLERVDGLGETAERFAVHAAGGVLLVGGVDGRVVGVLNHEVFRLTGHSAAVQDVAFGAEQGVYATASLDGSATLWNGPEVRLEHGAPIHRVLVTARGDRAITVGADRVAVLWDDCGVRIAELEGVTDAAFVADDRAVLAWSGDDPAQAMTLEGEPLPAPAGTERGIVRLVQADAADAFAWIAPDRTARVALAGDLGPPADPAVAHPAEAYAHPEWCARCHRPEYERWVESSHAWTSTLASEASLPRDVVRGRDVHHAPGVTQFGKDDSGWFAETVGPEGTVERFRLTHVAGHKRMKMLLTTLDDGRIQVLPAMTEWPDGPWFDYTHLLYGAPDADPALPPVVQPGEASFWTGSVRSWDQKCAVCHTSGRLPREPDAEGRGPRSVWRSLGVDCETCHGPGRAHAEAWERGETGTPLLRLEDLPRDAAVAVCTQCHMEGDRVTPSYRIGDDLYEHLDPTLVLSPERADPYGRPLELIYDGLPFGTSHCAESGGLTCSRCHEPHGSTDVSQLRFPPASPELCAGCHDDVAAEGRAHTGHDPRGSGGTCVACHLPFLTIERGHGAVADHTIGIPRLDLPGDRVATDACTWCHSGGRGAARDAPRVGAEALREAYARWWPDAAVPQPWMRAVARARSGDRTVGRELLAIARDAARPRLVRATATRLLESTASEHREGLFALAGDVDSLVRRAALLALRPVRGADVDAALGAALGDPSPAVRVNAARVVLAGWERARANRELLRSAIPVLREDVRLIPDDPYRWFLLGAAHGLAGDAGSELAAYERLLALDPLAHAVRAHVERLRAR